MTTITPKQRAIGYILVLAQVLLLLGLFSLAVHGIATGFALGVGYLAMTGGILLVSFSAFSMGKAFWPTPAPRNNAHLVEDGPFKVIRHPLYAGLMLFGLGAFLKSGHFASIYTLAALVIVLMVKISMEERLLRQRYPEFDNYRKSTPSLIPRIRKAR